MTLALFCDVETAVIAFSVHGMLVVIMYVRSD